MTILTERRRWWIAGTTLAISLAILIWGPWPSQKSVKPPAETLPGTAIPSQQ